MSDVFQQIMSVGKAAKELGLKPSQILNLIADGKLIAQKIGDSWAITKESVENYKKTRRPPGRPKGQ